MTNKIKTNIMEMDMEHTKLLYEKIRDEKAMITSDFKLLITRLNDSEKGIIVEIPWKEDINGRFYEKNQIVLIKMHNHRIYFSNPIPKQGIDLAEVGGNPKEGPRRKIEFDGKESIDIDTFEILFADGGSAIIKCL